MTSTISADFKEMRTILREIQKQQVTKEQYAQMKKQITALQESQAEMQVAITSLANTLKMTFASSSAMPGSSPPPTFHQIYPGFSGPSLRFVPSRDGSYMTYTQ